MEKYEIEKLRDLPIEEVASQLGLQVARHKSLCPFHSDHHASLSFNTRKNLCRCFVCMDESLDSIGLVMKSLHVDFPKACFWLADRNGILLEKARGRFGWRRDCCSSASPVAASTARDAVASSTASASASAASSTSASSPASPASSAASPAPHSFDAARYARFFEHPWLNEAACRFLFDERKIDGRVARWCRLSSWSDRKGVNWLQIPYFDREGRLVGIQNRNLDFHRKSRPTDSMDSEKTRKSSCPTDFTDDTDSEGSEDGTDSEEAPRFRFPYGSQCGIYNLQVQNLLTREKGFSSRRDAATAGQCFLPGIRL